MKKSDLKDGMVVELRKGTRLMLINDYLHNEMHEYNFNNYNEYLIHHQNVNILDIVKVYIIDISNIKEMFKSIKLKDMLADEFLKLIWEREEVDWDKVPVGTKVLVSDNENNWYEHLFIDYRNNEDFKFKCIDAKSKQIHNWKYCKLAEKPKEEVTFYDIEKEMNQYCHDQNEGRICQQECDTCGIKYILANYNLTRKDDK